MPGTAVVSVVSGAATTGIDATLVAAGAISGTVTDAAGHGLSRVYVEVFDSAGVSDRVEPTANDGTYDVSGLPNGSYTVCFSAKYAAGEDSPGYVDQCYANTTWTDYPSLPSGTTTVSVVAGTTAGNIDAALQPGGAVSGKVLDADGQPLRGAGVTTVTAAGVTGRSTSTASDGTYTLAGLPAGTFSICFSGRYASNGTPGHGYADQCYHDIAWESGEPLPDGVANVAVTPGTTTSGIDATLDAGGTVTGTVADSAGEELAGVAVTVLTLDGRLVTLGGYTRANGQYAINGIPEGTYLVCYHGSMAAGGSSAAGYLDGCYSSDGSGTATDVTVTAGATTGAVDGVLQPGAGVTGTVLDNSGNALRDVSVYAYSSSGALVMSTTSGNDGTYTMKGLSAGDYTVCFWVPPGADTGGSTQGYNGQCYAGIPWNGFGGGAPGSGSVTATAGMMTTGIDAALIPS